MSKAQIRGVVMIMFTFIEGAIILTDSLPLWPKLVTILALFVGYLYLDGSL